MTLQKRQIQPVLTQSGSIAAGGTVQVDIVIPPNTTMRLEADVLLVGSANGIVDKCSALPAEIAIRSRGSAAAAITAQIGSTNPQNSNTAGAAAARAVGDELVGGGGASSAVWTVAPGSIARLTITNGDAAEACEYDVVIWAHNVAFAFTPADLTLAAWYRADQGLVTGGSGLNQVQTWSDLASSPHDATKDMVQATAGKQPILIREDAAYGNRSVILFDGIDDFLASPAWSAAQAQPCTIFIVADAPLPSAGETFFSCQGSGTAFFQFNAAARFNAGAALDAPTATISSIWGIVANGAGSIIYNSALTPVVAGAAGAGGITDMVAGIFFDLVSNPLPGRIAEIVVANGVLSPAEVGALLTTYFGPRYGIAIGP